MSSSPNVDPPHPSSVGDDGQRRQLEPEAMSADEVFSLGRSHYSSVPLASAPLTLAPHNSLATDKEGKVKADDGLVVVVGDEDTIAFGDNHKGLDSCSQEPVASRGDTNREVLDDDEHGDSYKNFLSLIKQVDTA